MTRLNALGLIIAILVACPVKAQLPMSGVHVAELDVFDNAMQGIMSGSNYGNGVLAVSKDGVVVYQRGFGINVPENMPMRLASVEKPICAAAIRKLIAVGDLNWSDEVFGSSGILPHQPFNGTWGDTRLGNITVMDLVNHQGGWDRAKAPIGDPQFKAIQIASAMGIASPAGRDDIIRYMLTQPLEYDPGTNGCINANNQPTFCYSNFGYMVLGRIVEEVSGRSLSSFYRTRVITANMWIPYTEVFTGRALDINQDPREPPYHCSSCNCPNIFNPSGPGVPCPYGGFHIEAFKGHGNLVASAVPLLKYMDNYQVAVQSTAGTPLPPMSFGGGVFSGGMDGTSTCVWQRGDGTNIVVLFPRRTAGDLAGIAAGFISDIIDAQNLDWPTFAVDGFWVDFTAPAAQIEVGGYDHPFRTMNQALAVGSGAKIRLQPGSSSWTGTISHKILMDAPFGTATIGNN